MNERTEKIARLAFDPSAPEGEAIAAFLALRKTGNFLDEMKSPTSSTSSGSSSSNSPLVGRPYKLEFKLKIPPHSFDAFYHSLTHWSDDPYFRLSQTKDREKILDDFHFRLEAWFQDAATGARFNRMMNDVIESLNERKR